MLHLQGAVVRPVAGNPNPSAQLAFQQDWQMLQQVWDPQDQLPDFGQFPNSSSSGQGTESFQSQPGWESTFTGLPQPLVGQEDFFAAMDGFAPAPYQVPSPQQNLPPGFSFSLAPLEHSSCSRRNGCSPHFLALSTPIETCSSTSSYGVRLFGV